jgi:hypothetical protein
MDKLDTVKFDSFRKREGRGMRMSERLEQIKTNWNNYHMSIPDVKWLIEQAERVQEFEQVIGDLYEDIKELELLRIKEKRKAQRYKQALEFYADENNYREHDLKGIVPPRPITFKPILHDYGSIARQALESDEN